MGWVMGACRQSMSEQKKCLTCVRVLECRSVWRWCWWSEWGDCEVKLTISHLARTHEPRAAGRAGASPQGRAFSEHSWFHTDPKGEGRVTHGLYMRMQMLRVAGGGWDWAGRWRSRSWWGKHARLVHVFAMKTGVAWQGQGMHAIWQRGGHARGDGTFWRAGGRSFTGNNAPSFELTLLSKPFVTCKGRQLSWLPARPLP